MNRKFFFVIVFLLFLFDSVFGADDIFFLNPGKRFWIAYTYPVADHTEVFVRFFNGTKWETPIEVTDGVMSSFSPSIAVAPDGSLWIAWVTLDKKGSSVYAKRYKDGFWSKTFFIGEKDENEDRQPFIDVSRDGYAGIVWSGNDGNDDEIYFSFYKKGKWSKEIMVNNSNFSPDIDSSVCVFSENDIWVVWNGWERDSYVLKARERKLVRFHKSKRFDFEKVFPGSPKERCSFVSDGEKSFLFFYKKGDLFVAIFDKSGNLSVKKVLPHRFFLREIKKLNLYYMNELFIAYVSESGKNMGINLTLFLRFMKRNRFFKCREANYVYSFDEESIFEPLFGKKSNKKVSLLLFGDEFAYGCGGKKGGFGKTLFNLYGKNVKCDGFFGETMVSGIKRLEVSLNKEKPEKVVLIEGFNDVVLGRSPETIRFNVEKMIVESLSFGARPYPALIPINTAFRMRLKRTNWAIKDACRKTGFNYANTMRFFPRDINERNVCFKNVFYLNDAGYELMAYGIYVSLFDKK